VWWERVWVRWERAGLKPGDGIVLNGDALCLTGVVVVGMVSVMS